MESDTNISGKTFSNSGSGANIEEEPSNMTFSPSEHGMQEMIIGSCELETKSVVQKTSLKTSIKSPEMIKVEKLDTTPGRKHCGDVNGVSDLESDVYSKQAECDSYHDQNEKNTEQSADADLSLPAEQTSSSGGLYQSSDVVSDDVASSHSDNEMCIVETRDSSDFQNSCSEENTTTSIQSDAFGVSAEGMVSSSSFTVTECQPLEIEPKEVECASVDLATSSPSANPSPVEEPSAQSNETTPAFKRKKRAYASPMKKSLVKDSFKNLKARRITAKMKAVWAKELETTGRLQCPIQGCYQTYVTVANFQTHFKYCTGKTKLQHCPYCESLIFSSNEAVMRHMEVEHPDKVEEYKGECNDNGDVPKEKCSPISLKNIWDIGDEMKIQTSVLPTPVITKKRKPYTSRFSRSSKLSSPMKENSLHYRKAQKQGGIKSLQKSMNQNVQRSQNCVRFNDIVQKINSVAEGGGVTKVKSIPFESRIRQKPKKLFLREVGFEDQIFDVNEESVHKDAFNSHFQSEENVDDPKPGGKVGTKSRFVLNDQGYERFSQSLKVTRDWSSERRTYSRSRGSDQSNISLSDSSSLPNDVHDVYQLNEPFGSNASFSAEEADIIELPGAELIVASSIKNPEKVQPSAVHCKRNLNELYTSTPQTKNQEIMSDLASLRQVKIEDLSKGSLSSKTALNTHTHTAVIEDEENYGHILFSKPNKISNKERSTCYDNAGNDSFKSKCRMLQNGNAVLDGAADSLQSRENLFADRDVPVFDFDQLIAADRKKDQDTANADPSISTPSVEIEASSVPTTKESDTVLQNNEPSKLKADKSSIKSSPKTKGETLKGVLNRKRFGIKKVPKSSNKNSNRTVSPQKQPNDLGSKDADNAKLSEPSVIVNDSSEISRLFPTLQSLTLKVVQELIVKSSNFSEPGSVTVMAISEKIDQAIENLKFCYAKAQNVIDSEAGSDVLSCVLKEIIERIPEETCPQISSLEDVGKTMASKIDACLESTSNVTLQNAEPKSKDIENIPKELVENTETVCKETKVIVEEDSSNKENDFSQQMLANPPVVKRKRGRPRKNKLPENANQSQKNTGSPSSFSKEKLADVSTPLSTVDGATNKNSLLKEIPPSTINGPGAGISGNIIDSPLNGEVEGQNYSALSEQNNSAAVRRSTRIRKRKVDPDAVFLDTKKRKTQKSQSETVQQQEKKLRPKKTSAKQVPATIGNMPSEQDMMVSVTNNNSMPASAIDEVVVSSRKSSRKGRPRKLVGYEDINLRIERPESLDVPILACKTKTDLSIPVGIQEPAAGDQSVGSSVQKTGNTATAPRKKGKRQRKLGVKELEPPKREDLMNETVGKGGVCDSEDAPSITEGPVEATPEICKNEDLEKSVPMDLEPDSCDKPVVADSSVPSPFQKRKRKKIRMNNYLYLKKKKKLLLMKNKKLRSCWRNRFKDCIKSEEGLNDQKYVHEIDVCHVEEDVKDVADVMPVETGRKQRSSRTAAIKARKMLLGLLQSEELSRTKDEKPVKPSKQKDDDFIPTTVEDEEGNEEEEDVLLRDIESELEKYKDHFTINPATQPEMALKDMGDLIEEWLKQLSDTGKIICQGCGKTLQSRSAMIYHYENACQSTQERWTCNLCDKIFKPSPRKMLIHMNRNHLSVLAPEEAEKLNFLRSQRQTVSRFYKSQNGVPLDWKFLTRHHQDDLFPEFLPKREMFRLLDQNQIKEFLPPWETSIYFKINRKNKKNNLPWTRLSRFESFNDVGKSCNAFFIGGSVSNCEWCPTGSISGATQYIALASVCKDENAHHDSTQQSKGLIQFWEAGVLNSKKVKTAPVLSFVIPHKYGKIWDMKFCPFGCWEDPSKPVPDDRLPRLGLLALACDDSFIRIMSLPHPQFLKKSPSESLPFYSCQPVAVLQLPYEDNGAGNHGYLPLSCLCISWQKVGHCDAIAGGYSNGLMAFYRPKGGSAMLRSKVTHGVNKSTSVFHPFLTVQAHKSPVTSIDFSPFGSQWCASCSYDISLKIWDISDGGLCVSERKRGNAMSVKWPSIWTGIFVGLDSGLNATGTTTFFEELRQAINTPLKHGIMNILMHKACQLSFSVSEWLNAVAASDVSGEVTACQLNRIFGSHKHFFKRRFPVFRTEIAELTDLPVPPEIHEVVDGLINSCELTDKSEDAGQTSERKEHQCCKPSNHILTDDAPGATSRTSHYRYSNDNSQGEKSFTDANSRKHSVYFSCLETKQVQLKDVNFIKKWRGKRKLHRGNRLFGSTSSLCPSFSHVQMKKKFVFNSAGATSSKQVVLEAAADDSYETYKSVNEVLRSCVHEVSLSEKNENAQTSDLHSRSTLESALNIVDSGVKPSANALLTPLYAPSSSRTTQCNSQNSCEPDCTCALHMFRSPNSMASKTFTKKEECVNCLYTSKKCGLVFVDHDMLNLENIPEHELSRIREENNYEDERTECSARSVNCCSFNPNRGCGHWLLTVGECGLARLICTSGLKHNESAADESHRVPRCK